MIFGHWEKEETHPSFSNALNVAHAIANVGAILPRLFNIVYPRIALKPALMGNRGVYGNPFRVVSAFPSRCRLIVPPSVEEGTEGCVSQFQIPLIQRVVSHPLLRGMAHSPGVCFTSLLQKVSVVRWAAFVSSILPASVLIMTSSACHACGPFFAESYLVDGAERGDMVMTLPEGVFGFDVARIYTNQPPVPTNAFCPAYTKGRACLDQWDFAAAIRWFEECRAQTRTGALAQCADRSVGWQALAEMHHGDLASCIRHYYEQGDRRSLVSYVLPAIPRLGRAEIEKLAGDDVVLRVIAAYDRELQEACTSPMQGYRPDAYFKYEKAVTPTRLEQQNIAAFSNNLVQALANRGIRLPVRHGDVFVNVLRRHLDLYAIRDALAANEESLVQVVADDTSRRAVTAWVASRSRFEFHGDMENSGYRGVSGKLLAAVEKALTNRHVGDVDGILRLAYDAGNYASAERWLALSDKQSVIAQWIESKLLLRQGRFDDAREALHRLLPKITPASDAAELCAYDEPDLELGPLVGVPDASNSHCYCMAVTDARTYTARVGRVAAMVNSEIGLIALRRNDFMLAFDAFVHGKTWEDVAYMAEKVLTCDELERYLAGHADDPALQRAQWFPGWGYNGAEIPIGARLGYLLARRYARAHEWARALAWMPGPDVPGLGKQEGGSVSQKFARFVNALAHAENTQLTAEQRADGYAAAGRAAGMAFLGTETGPDWACYGGSFTKDEGWLSSVQRYGIAPIIGLTNTDNAERKPCKCPDEMAALFHATSVEVSRVNATWPTPCKRFHYRYYAADLMWQGAALLPRNSEKAARILHEGGTLLMNRDPKAADRFHKEIVNRHGRTELGKRVRTKNWFLRESEWAAYLGAMSTNDARVGQQQSLRIPTSGGTGWIAVAIGTVERATAGFTQDYLRVVLALEGVPDAVNAYEAEIYHDEKATMVDMAKLAMPLGKQAVKLTRKLEPTALKVGCSSGQYTCSMIYKAQEGTNHWEYTTTRANIQPAATDGTPTVVTPPDSVDASAVVKNGRRGDSQLVLLMNPMTRLNGGYPPSVVRVMQQTPSGPVCIASETNAFHRECWEDYHADVAFPDEGTCTVETTVDFGPLGGAKVLKATTAVADAADADSGGTSSDESHASDN